MFIKSDGFGSHIGFSYVLTFTSPIAKFWLYLIFLIPSIICSFFVLYHLIFDRVLRRSLHNHVIIVLLITVIICEFTVYPWMLYYFYNNDHWSRSYTFCLIWGFIDWAVYILQLILFAWASIERHILIFHDKWVSTEKKRFYVHYLPLVIIILYWLIFYMIVYLYTACPNTISEFEMVCITICLYRSFAFRSTETILHYVIPCFTVIVLSIWLLLRVIWQKHSMRQPIQWRRHRKMTVQLLSISILYLLVTVPWAIMILLRICGLSYEFGEKFESVAFYISYYIVLFFPFVALFSLPELRNKFNKLLHLPKKRRLIVPEAHTVTEIPRSKNTLKMRKCID